MTIKRIFQIVLISSSVLSIIFLVPWKLLYLNFRPLSTSIQEELDFYVDNGFDGVIVNIRSANEEVSYSAGFHNKEENIAAYPDAIFKIASISKLFIAQATIMIVDDGLIALDDKLADLLPEYSQTFEYADQITIEHLISHRSGIYNFTDNENYPWDDLPKSNQESLAFAIDKKALFEPGKKYDYSNSNYALLGIILSKTLGYDYQEYIDQHILKPLGLNNTYHTIDEVDINQVMSGYYIGYEPDLKYSQHLASSGAMLSSASDVSKYIWLLNKKEAMSPEVHAIYQSLYPLEHTGLLPGYQSIAKYNPKLDKVVVLFVSTSGKGAWGKIESLYNRINKILSK